MGHGIVLIYVGLGILTSVIFYFTLKAENARRDRGMRDEIIDGVNNNGTFVCCPTRPLSLTDSFRNVGDLETVERLTRFNGRFVTVEDAKREKGDNWSGYRYIL